jgi:hypothetical protein
LIVEVDDIEELRSNTPIAQYSAVIVSKRKKTSFSMSILNGAV